MSVCSATSVSSDDGSTGAFYCINGGTVGGTPGNCTCTSCNAGYSGNNCETAALCTDPSPPNHGTIGDCTGKQTLESCSLKCDDGYHGQNLTVTCSGNTNEATSSIDTSGASCTGNIHTYIVPLFWRRPKIVPGLTPAPELKLAE